MNTRADLELAQDVLHMDFHGSFGYSVFTTNFLVASASYDAA